ncbi:MAG: hypothetical protein ABW224_23125 [Kibdelosporangium sp.]
MAWQDDLKSLDEELSSGRIPAEEYRRRRDELLAAASSNPVGMRRIHRKQPASIANAFNGDPKSDADITQQVDVNAAAPQWQATPPANGQPAPPPRDLGAPVQPKQGAEVFGLAVSSGPRTTSKWPRFVAAIVALAVVAAGVWWFAFRDPSDAPNSASAQGEQPARPAPLGVGSLPNPVDVPLTYSGTLTVDQMQIYNLTTPEEAALLVAAGTDEVYYRGVTAGNLQYHIYAYRTKDAQSSQQLMAKLTDRNKRIGMADITVQGLSPKVKTQQVSSEATSISEAIYVADRAAVRIVIGQSKPLDDDKLGSAMRRSVDALVRSVPPT